MNNNINLYIGKSGKYSPKMSENRRNELKNFGSESGKNQPKKLNNIDIWNSIREDYARLTNQNPL